jgi:hypothetical protein
VTVTRQLAFELTPEKVEDLLDDLDFRDHEQRLDALAGALEGVDFLPAPAPKCGCDRHRLPIADEWGDPRCLLCGREVTRDDTSGQATLSGDVLQGGPSGEAR